jgi:hypothetical protein
LALAVDEWSSSLPGHFTPRERALGTYWIGGWVDDLEKRKFLTLLGLELQPLGHPAHSLSLYQLHYPGFEVFMEVEIYTAVVWVKMAYNLCY